METKWTPGPWALDTRKKYRVKISAASGKWYEFASVVVRMEHEDEDNEEGTANANLIVAAPELYEALKKAADRLAEIGATVPSDVTHALAKARGE